MNDNVHIGVIIDNTTLRTDFITEHGLSLWIEYRDRKILFDTGQSNAVISNAKKLGINLKSADAIVLSHGHYDHTGGLADVLNIATKAKVYLHPSAMEPKFGKKASDVKNVGMTDSAKKAIENQPVVFTKKPENLFPGVVVTGQIPRINDFEDVGGAFFLHEQCQKPDSLLDDQALFVNSSKGIVVVLGCAHSGVVNILDYVSELANCKKIHALIGGMHLLNADQKRIEHTLETFRKYDIQKVIPLHCTGEKVMKVLKNILGDRCLLLGAGEKIIF